MSTQTDIIVLKITARRFHQVAMLTATVAVRKRRDVL